MFPKSITTNIYRNGSGCSFSLDVLGRWFGKMSSEEDVIGRKLQKNVSLGWDTEALKHNRGWQPTAYRLNAAHHLYFLQPGSYEWLLHF